MVSFRTFRNGDPPDMLRLWHASQLGRGAASGFLTDAWDEFLFCQLYFDPAGLILAWEEKQLVGMVHAGFGGAVDGSALDRSIGVICLVMVHPAFRRQGIGRELIRRAEEYLRNHGAKEIRGGGAEPHDPFYHALYGGARPSGFLESDPAAAPFMKAMGYEPIERHLVLQRNLTAMKTSLTSRVFGLRTQFQLQVTDEADYPTWWWMTRIGRMEPIRFLLFPRNGNECIGGITVYDMILYPTKWKARTVALLNLQVAQEHRRKGYGESLVNDVCRRLKQESIDLVEIHVLDENSAARSLLETTGFEQTDVGVVYRKSS